ncbi:hypothetical protein VitviT2T_021686 [Vitis vinifera]|uniref:Uncharacterized protein n=1 Tax=Vitis vinifera TaxID=29760 RepID=A0ABY9DAG4_VITVI|nr:hypothetical protein VitviT2T_021686 [Vitis vinifera]
MHISTTDPLPHLSIKDTPIEISSAQYILQQYTTVFGGQKLQNSIRNAYAMGKLNPDMWYVELEVGGNKVRSSCNSKLVWRHTLWLGAHSAKGPIRPLH